MTDTGATFRWASASMSHGGLVREMNEDACLDCPAEGLWAVADGMGGHSLGDMASRAVVEALGRIAAEFAGKSAADDPAETCAAARAALLAVNRQLRTEAVERGVSVIGSTVVVLAARDGRCGLLWAGDSRIYLYRNRQLTQLTRDHSQVAELVSQGTLTPEEAVDYPFRNLITRAVGAADSLELDEAALEAADGDVFLLCSDGLSNEVGEEEISIALAGGSCSQAAELLIDLALKHGGRDNISVVVVRADQGQGPDKTLLNPIFL